ncbi:MAG TPA: hypothetical protein VGM56_30850 [Byssovorax sp.]|jgi:hypothetical protein
MKIVLVSAAVAAVALSFAGLRSLDYLGGVAQAETAHPSLGEVAPALVMPAAQVACADAVLCVGDCKKGDAACVSACERAIGGAASEHLYRALISCADEHACDGDGLCARSHCEAQLTSCLAASAPAGGCR